MWKTILKNFYFNRGVIILLLGFCIVFVHYSIRYGYGILLPEMLLSFGISKLEAGVIYTSYFIGYTVFSFILGINVDKFDVRKVVSIFLLLLGLGVLFMSLSNTVVEAAFSFFLAGVGCAACWVPIVVMVQRWFKKKALSVAAIDMGASIGFALSGVYMPILVAMRDWRFGWQVLSAASFLLSPLAWLILKSRPESSYQEKKDNEKSFKRLAEIIKDLKLWMLGISYMLVGFYIMVPFTFLTTYALQEIHLPYGIAAALISVIAIGAIPGKLTLASFSERAGRFKAMVLSGIMSIIGISGIIIASLLQDLEFIVTVLSTVVYGVGYGSVWPLYMAYASDLFSEDVGAALGLLTVLLGVGCMASPPAAGWIADLTKTLKTSFLIAVIASILSILFLIPTKRKISQV
ncbi:MAG: MFS transporter [Candidatus Bathyarchaeia archaeon]